MLGTAGSLSKAMPSSCGSFSSSLLSKPASRAAVWSSSSASASLSVSLARAISSFSTAGLGAALALVFETFDAALSGLTVSVTVTFSTFPGVDLTVVVFLTGFSSGSRKSSARFLVDRVSLVDVATGAASLVSFLALVVVVVVVSIFLRADFGAGFSTTVVLTFLVVTLGSDAPGASN